jgi:hypothetical protein
VCNVDRFDDTELQWKRYRIQIIFLQLSDKENH